jgi:hypothetical protein
METQKVLGITFNKFNFYRGVLKNDLKTLIDETTFLIHSSQFRSIKNKYLEVYE